MTRRRGTAWLLCLAMLMPSACAAEATPPEAAKEQPANSVGMTKEEEEKLSELARQAQQTQTPSGQQTQTPAAQQSPPGEETGDFVPSGEAWAELADGSRIDGELQSVLDRVGRSGGRATVYLLTLDAIEVKDVPEELLLRVAFLPDKTVFPGGASRYEIVLTPKSEGSDILIVQAARITAEETTQPEETTEPQETTKPQETDKPGEATPSEPVKPPETTPPPEVTSTPEPKPTPTPEPELCLTVTPEGYTPGKWMTAMPTFGLSGIGKDERKRYIYGVFICDERLILLDENAQSYAPDQEGRLSLRFAILDMMGDVAALSPQFDLMIDTQPPQGPYLTETEWSNLAAVVDVSDAASGLEAISFDYGYTWEPYVPSETGYLLTGRKGEVIDQRQIAVRDFAGHVSYNEVGFVFGQSASSGGGGGGSGKPPVRHVRETLDYSTANYNALELSFPEEPMEALTAGGEMLSLTLTRESDEGQVSECFTARMTTWLPSQGEQPDAPNTLVLEAQSVDGANTWSFSGDVYKLLYNSGVDYLVLRSGEYIAAIPTAGFTGGTQYGKLKAGGVSTRKFAYTLLQDEPLRETALSVTVEGETYLLEEDTDRPMYRYDVLIGTAEMMEDPYDSFFPEVER